MNSRNLIISFVTVSVAALTVSAFAVFTVARRYAAELTERSAEKSISAPESTEAPEESAADTVSTNEPETEEGSSETSAEAELTVSATEEITEAAEVTSASEHFVLSLSGDRLVITSPAGTTVYERIIDTSELRQKDREALLSGMEFPDKNAAMSAVYDLIS